MSIPPSTFETARTGGGVEWFAREVQSHDGQLKAYLRACLRDKREVEDIVQESYLRMWKLRAGTPIRSAKAFLFRVARNLVFDRQRRQRATGNSFVGDLSVCDVVDERTNVADAVCLHETERLFAEALSALPARAHEVVVLCRLEGLSHREAGARLGISVRTVDEHLRRGMKRLGEELRKRGLCRLGSP